jgi:hypothetical protein
MGAVDGLCGIFVSSSLGHDGDAGTKAKPVATLAHALEIAHGTTIYACGETFDEALTLSAGVTLLGALDCANAWTYDATKPTKVAPAAAGPALVVADVAATVRIDDVAFVAKDGAAPGDSSIGAFVHGSSDVTLNRVAITAGKGVTGASGTLTPFTYPMQTDLNGNSATGGSGGPQKVCTCPAGDESSGGTGGNANTGGQSGGAGSPDRGGGQGGMPGGGCVAGVGRDGNAGASAASALGAASLGTLSVSGWTPAGGDDGLAGGPGQGGGGGASTATAGGGGGGCGGCGGAGATGGKGGGASIALLLLDSSLTLNACSLAADDAGSGGAGLAGQVGQPDIGLGGTQGLGACPGGNGAAGGNGSASGGGAGGVSAAIAYKGTAPAANGGALSHGTAGGKGVGGDVGVNDGLDGGSGDSLPVN